MPDHVVKLHYTKNPDPNGKPLFKPEPQTIFVKTGHTISFQKADESVPGSIRITFQSPEIFSAPETDGSMDVKVTGTPITTTYHCELIGLDGTSVAHSNEKTGGGGDIKPDPPPSS
ncbi:MAG TPA: hypothetical protein VGH38_03875 [Bryobacteraceae bacterium]|jgi:hypothetical protein